MVLAEPIVDARIAAWLLTPDAPEVTDTDGNNCSHVSQLAVMACRQVTHGVGRASSRCPHSSMASHT